MMTDAEALDFLVAKTGSKTAAAVALGGILLQRMANWRERGIALRARSLVWRVCNEHGARLPVRWQIAPQLKPATEKGNGHGRARKIKAKGKNGQRARQRKVATRLSRAQQRRSARRGLQPLAP